MNAMNAEQIPIPRSHPRETDSLSFSLMSHKLQTGMGVAFAIQQRSVSLGEVTPDSKKSSFGISRIHIPMEWPENRNATADMHHVTLFNSCSKTIKQ